ncbi:hypothetical protein BURPS1655_A1629 [Burkholderia pseudomallei 1655]|nr:hypothetical protein BURPS1655_A1629 [Burkholderia pseudomallei 1655]
MGWDRADPGRARRRDGAAMRRRRVRRCAGPRDRHAGPA